ncbi:hypothetical protein ALC53_00217 [Atta colombica]|uniref:Uncharacterized protein n=1 Tax=Atta colombica TaxID=520822 RepID=A0A195BZC7_9HYME|nr:hypothetical protein ALC53_00217 [Atta colombica]
MIYCVRSTEATQLLERQSNQMATQFREEMLKQSRLVTMRFLYLCRPEEESVQQCRRVFASPKEFYEQERYLLFGFTMEY